MPKNAEPIRLLRDELDTPVGRLLVLTDESGALFAAGWLERPARAARSLIRFEGDPRYTLSAATNPGGASQALRAYFDGELSALDALRVADFGTSFQRRVWTALRSIPCGTTISYAELARRIQHPSAVRAVGLANGANPVCIVVPCHRVIGANGTLTGYAGGLERKRWLLAHERALPAVELPFETAVASSTRSTPAATRSASPPTVSASGSPTRAATRSRFTSS
jgi:methylated-DNA-[protein]-cysteine S-methyltransferase